MQTYVFLKVLDRDTVRTASYDVPPAPDRIPHFIINIALYILVIIIIIYYYYYYIRDITESS